MDLNKPAFFAAVRSSLFGGKLSVDQVKGMEAILDEAESRGTRLEWLAYMLATAYHETAQTMQPVRETLASSDDKAIQILDRAFAAGKLSWVKTPYWRKDRDGKSWLGRGLPQLTHKRNYEIMSPIVGVDLVADPNRAMDPPVAIKIMFEGMERGSFTAHKLSAHINDQKTDYYNARRIINGVESAAKVATYAKQFEAALRAAGYDGKPYLPARDEKPVAPAPLPAREPVAEPVNRSKLDKPATLERKPTAGNWLAGIFAKILDALLKGGKA